MKVAIYNPYLDTLGGGERYTMAFATSLKEAGYSVDVQWADSGISTKLEERFGINLQGINFVKDVRIGDGYDLCFWVSDGSIPLLHARKNILHFQVPFKGVNGKTLFNRMKLARVDKVICNSRFTKKIVDEEYGFAQKSIVIPPPVDTKKFRPKRKENIIAYIGRFSELKQNKRPDVLVDAFSKFTKVVDKQWMLVLAGGVEIGVSEDYMINLRAKIGDLNVKVVESPSFEQILEIVGRARFFWSASGYGVDEEKEPERVEHFGITVVEAMAAGTIPLVYGAGGQKSIVEDGVSGFLWKKKSELVAKTLDLIKSGELIKISKSAQERAKNFSYEKFVEKVLANL